MRLAVRSVALAIILGTLAFLPTFMAAAGHDSRSIFVTLAKSEFLKWPFSVADYIIPTTSSTAILNLGVAIHYAFYIFVAWLLGYFLRFAPRPAA